MGSRLAAVINRATWTQEYLGKQSSLNTVCCSTWDLKLYYKRGNHSSDLRRNTEEFFEVFAHFRGTELQWTHVCGCQVLCAKDDKHHQGCYQLLHLFTPSCTFRSADQLLLSVPNSKRKLRGDVALQLSHQKCGMICFILKQDNASPPSVQHPSSVTSKM